MKKYIVTGNLRIRSVYVRLGRAIFSPDMESIALGYPNIDEEIIKSLRYEHRGNSEAFNRDILKRWAYRNPGSNQVEVRNGLVMMHCK